MSAHYTAPSHSKSSTFQQYNTLSFGLQQSKRMMQRMHVQIACEMHRASWLTLPVCLSIVRNLQADRMNGWLMQEYDEPSSRQQGEIKRNQGTSSTFWSDRLCGARRQNELPSASTFLQVAFLRSSRMRLFRMLIMQPLMLSTFLKLCRWQERERHGVSRMDTGVCFTLEVHRPGTEVDCALNLLCKCRNRKLASILTCGS